MLTCKEASYLASKKLDKRLTLRESMGWLLHVSLCKLCRHYAKDLKKLQNSIQKTGKSGLAMLPESVKLSDQSKQRITQVIKKALHQTK